MRSSSEFLEATGLTHGFGSKRVLNDISINLHPGEVLGLIGPNGCGKSTLMKIISGILPFQSGQVKVSGQEFARLSTAEKARQVTYLGADLHTEFPLSGRDAVMMGRIAQGHPFPGAARELDDQLVIEAMKRVGCVELQGQNVQTMSSGERQLISLARAIAQGAKILLLDESLSQMDLHHQAEIGNLLQELAGEGYGIMLVSHDLNLTTEWASRCFLMAGGRVVADGETRAVLTPENLRKLYPSTDLILGANPSSGAPKVYFRKKP